MENSLLSEMIKKKKTKLLAAAVYPPKVPIKTAIIVKIPNKNDETVILNFNPYVFISLLYTNVLNKNVNKSKLPVNAPRNSVKSL